MILLLFAVLQVADIVSTVFCLGNGLKEANPLAAKLFSMIGVVPGAILLKVTVGGAMAAVFVRHPQYWPLLAAYCFVLAGIVAQNFIALRDVS